MESAQADENLIQNRSSMKRITLEVDWSYWKIPFLSLIYIDKIPQKKKVNGQWTERPF